MQIVIKICIDFIDRECICSYSSTTVFLKFKIYLLTYESNEIKLTKIYWKSIIIALRYEFLLRLRLF